MLRLNDNSITATATPSNSKPMSCANCQDVLTNVPDITSRGLGARALLARGVPTKTVVVHLCKKCGTDWKVVGVGKAKQMVATHKCTSCGSESIACCNTAKGDDVATKGMEQQLNVAPLK